MPDIYEENKYQRRNLLLYHCLLESGLPKFNVSEHFLQAIQAATPRCPISAMSLTLQKSKQYQKDINV
jgi:hypothetical protein